MSNYTIEVTENVVNLDVLKDHDIIIEIKSSDNFITFETPSGYPILFTSGTLPVDRIGSGYLIENLTSGNTIVRTLGDQVIDGNKTFSNNIVSSGNLVIKSQAASITPSYFPVFISDPSTFSRTVFTRTSSQVKSDIGLNDVQNIALSNINFFAGSGLVGGGNLSSSRSFDIGQGDGLIVTSDSVAVDSTVVRTNVDQIITGRKTFTNPLIFNSGNFQSLQVLGVNASVSGHTHTISNITGLQTALDDKQASGNYASSSHTHTSSNITDFNSSVSGLINVKDILGNNGINIENSNGIYTITNSFPVSTYALGSHTHVSSNITDFNVSVSGLLPVKNVTGTGYVTISSTTGNYTVSVTGLQPSGSYASSSHTHTSSDITNFNTSVSGLVNGIYAPLSSPSLIGTPLTPTAPNGTNNTQIASTAFVRTEISNLVASAPTALDTLNELAAALGNDASFSTTVTNNLAGKANLSGATFTGSVSGPSGNFTSLKVNSVDVSANGHTHTVSNITDFNSSVSGLLPVGTANYLSKFGTGGGGLSNSLVFDNGTNVGIGTASPSNRLEVAGGNVLIGPSDATRQLNFYSSSYGIKAQSGLEVFTGDIIRFRKGSTEYARIDANGNVGIGTTTPSGQLHVIGTGIFSSGIGVGITTPLDLIHVSGSSANAQGIRLENADGYGGSIQADNGALYFKSSTATAFRVQAAKIRLGDGATSTAIELSSNGSISQDGNGGGLTFNGTTALFSNGINVTNSGIFGSVGIGTTTPQELLHVSGTISSNVGNLLRLNNSSATTNPSINFRIGGVSNFDSHFFISRNGTDVFGIDTQNKGVFLSSFSLYGNQQFFSYNNANAAIKLQNLTTNDLEIGAVSGILFQSQQSTKMKMDKDGNFGIGTITPGAQLHVIGSGIFSSGIYISDLANGTYINGNSSVMDFFVNNNRSMRLSQYGSLAINMGTSSALGTLHTKGNGSNLTAASDPFIVESSVASGSVIRFKDTASNDWQIGVNPNGSITTGTASGNFAITRITSNSGIPYLTISSSGNVGIGTTTPSGSLHVVGDVYIDNSSKLYIVASGQSKTRNFISSPTNGNLEINAGGPSILFSPDGGYVDLGRTASQFINIGHGYLNAGANGQHIRFTPGGSELMRMTNSGTMGIGLPLTSSLFNQQPYANTRVHIAGSGADSGSAALIVTNSGISPLLYVRNDGNVGIGTASPTSTLQVSGLITANSGNFTQSLQVNGTGVISSSGGTTNYISKFTGNSTIANSLVYDNGINVGIGTTTPIVTFQVGPSSPTSNANYSKFNGLRVGGYDTSNTIWNENRDISITRDIGGKIYLCRNSVPIVGMNVDTTTGDVGIGTVSPSGKLHVIGSGIFSSGIIVGDSSTNGYIYGPSGNANIQIYTAGTRIDVTATNIYFVSSYTYLNGSVTYVNGTLLFPKTGAATTSIATQSNPNELRFYNGLWNGSSSYDGYNTLHSIASTSVSGASRFAVLMNNGDGTQNRTERLSILSNGNIGIGTSSPSVQLDVVGSGRFTGRCRVDNLTINTDSTTDNTASYLATMLLGYDGASLSGGGLQITTNTNRNANKAMLGLVNNKLKTLSGGSTSAKTTFFSEYTADTSVVSTQSPEGNFVNVLALESGNLTLINQNLYIKNAPTPTAYDNSAGDIINSQAYIYMQGASSGSPARFNNVYNYYSRGQFATSHSYATNFVDFYAAPIVNQTVPSGIITTRTALLIDYYAGNTAHITNPRGIWQLGSSVTNHLAGTLGIGTTTPSSQLHVIGSGVISSGLIVNGNLTFDSFTESVVAIGNSSTSQTISLTSGTVQTCTLTGNCTFTMPTATAGKSFSLFLNTGSGGFTATFTGVRWSDSTPPTITSAASKVDLLSFISDGSFWYGSFSQNYG